MTALYKKAKNGKIQQWSIEVDGSRFRTIEGYVDGKLTTNKWTECQGKNVGRANETSAEEQAAKEALSKAQKKKDRGYVESIDQVDDVVIVEPMLAHKWDKYRDKTHGPIALQPKLDGIRCIASKKGLFTRNGKKIVAAPHIERAVRDIVEDTDIVLDGELYNHDLKDDFNQITSIVRKTKPKDEDIDKSRQVLQYHVYDLMMCGSFSARSAAISALIAHNHPCIKVVPTTFVEDVDHDKIDELYQVYLGDGYEGQMIRAAESDYQHGRSRNLLKRKEFIDQEFEIMDIEEGVGNRSGMMGRIKFRNFDANARGSHETFTDMLINKGDYIGKLATVRYQNLTPDGVPRFPVVVAIRDYE